MISLGLKLVLAVMKYDMTSHKLLTIIDIALGVTFSVSFAIFTPSLLLISAKSSILSPILICVLAVMATISASAKSFYLLVAIDFVFLEKFRTFV